MPGAYLLQGDARALPLADASIQCVVSSPPYWGLRDYGLAPSVWGGADHAHEWGDDERSAQRNRNWQGGSLDGGTPPGMLHPSTGAFCPCGAWRGVLGLEPTPDLYVAHMVEVFREVRRVLRPDGVCFLNLGDSYCSTDKWGGGGPNTGKQTVADDGSVPSWQVRQRREPYGLKPKDLVGIPWRVAFALQADGWWLRSDIIWAKKNCMPESVTDRPTRSHEYVFLLTKSPRYFFDQEAVRGWQNDGRDEATLRQVSKGSGIETASPTIRGETGDTQAVLRFGQGQGDDPAVSADTEGSGSARSRRPQAPGQDGDPQHPIGSGLAGDPRGVRPCLCVLSQERSAHEGSCRAAIEGRASHPGERDSGLSELQQSERKQDGHGRRHAGFNGRWDAAEDTGSVAPGRNMRSVWFLATEPFAAAHFATFPQALVEPCILAGTSARGACPPCGAPWRREVAVSRMDTRPGHASKYGELESDIRLTGGKETSGFRHRREVRVGSLGWSPSCACPSADPVPQRVLDPFSGSGTTVAVAERLGRVGVGVELKPDYLALARRRTVQAGLL